MHSSVNRLPVLLAILAWAAAPLAAQEAPTLLDEATLATRPTFRRLETALQTPDSVYKMALSSDRASYYSRFANPSHNTMPPVALPDELATLTRLQALSINYLTINEGYLPAVVGRLPSLQTLDLSKGTLQRLPEELGSLQHLTTLNVAGNRLTTLPDGIGRLENLVALDASNNFLILLPTTLHGLKSLTRLDISNNRAMALLVPQVGALTNLTELNANGCTLPAVPQELGNLTNLTTLRLADNRLTELPNSLSNLTQLQVLDLSNNYLSTLPPDLVNLAGTLRELNLKGNFLTKADKARVRQMFPNTRLRL